MPLQFQAERLERSLRVLLYLKALVEEAMNNTGHRKRCFREAEDYCKKYRKPNITVITKKIVRYVAKHGLDLEVVKLVFRTIEDLRNEQVALGFKPPKKKGGDDAA